jgi:aryl-alcohol dehydrogenase-like predicted oxidoreductase
LPRFTALDAGITLLDTGDFYGMGHNEMLIAEAMKGVPRDEVIVSVKFGALRDPAGGWVGFDARPQAVKNFLASRYSVWVSTISTFTDLRVSILRCR